MVTVLRAQQRAEKGRRRVLLHIHQQLVLQLLLDKVLQLVLQLMVDMALQLVLRLMVDMALQLVLRLLLDMALRLVLLLDMALQLHMVLRQEDMVYEVVAECNIHMDLLHKDHIVGVDEEHSRDPASHTDTHKHHSMGQQVAVEELAPSQEAGSVRHMGPLQELEEQGPGERMGQQR